jgi:hypothetical protein
MPRSTPEIFTNQAACGILSDRLVIHVRSPTKNIVNKFHQMADAHDQQTEIYFIYKFKPRDLKDFKSSNLNFNNSFLVVLT